MTHRELWAAEQERERSSDERALCARDTTHLPSVSGDINDIKNDIKNDINDITDNCNLNYTQMTNKSNKSKIISKQRIPTHMTKQFSANPIPSSGEQHNKRNNFVYIHTQNSINRRGN
jgi:hypothetical protein